MYCHIGTNTPSCLPVDLPYAVLMEFSDEQVQEFQELYKSETGREIPEAHVRTVMFQLIMFMEVLVKPLPLPPPKDQEG